MKSIGLSIAAAAVLIWTPPLPAFEADNGPEDCAGIASEIARFVDAKGISRIMVRGFAPRGGAEKSEADYVSVKTASCLAGDKNPVQFERALLEKALKGLPPSSPAGAGGNRPRISGDGLSMDAVVTGLVVAAGGKLKTLAVLIDVKTGRVLMAAQGETVRPWPRFADAGAEPPPRPSDLRDAVSDPARSSCAERGRRLAALEEELADIKAWYWAAMMRAPGFSVEGLSRNPGSEISDPTAKDMFYRLLDAYYQAESLPLPDPDKLSRLMSLLDEENRFPDECGYR